MASAGGKVQGTSVRRLEDVALLRGEGCFVDDISFPGMLHAAFVRSPHAHAAIRGIDKTDWVPIDRATYDACLDRRDYRRPDAPGP